jgi:hypothetical protein
VAASRTCLSCQSGQALCPVTSRILLTLHEPMYRWKLASTRGGRLPFVMLLVFLNQFTLPVCTLCVTFNGKFANDMGREGVGSIASRSGSRFEPHWETRFLRPCRPALWLTQPPVQCAGSISQGYSGRSVVSTAVPHLAPKIKSSTYLPSPSVPSWQVMVLKSILTFWHRNLTFKF